MNCSTAVATARQGAFSGAPGRLNRIVQFGAALGRDDAEHDDAIDAIEEALWADGLLNVDRPSQRRAWQLTLARAEHAYHEAGEEAEAAAYRGQRAARTVFDGLSPAAALEDFAAALSAAEPLLDNLGALRIARGIASSLMRPPAAQRGPSPDENSFAETAVDPGLEDYARQRRACEMLGIDSMNAAADLRIATSDGEAVPAAVTASREAPDLDSVVRECIDRLRAVGTPDAIRAEQMLQRHRLGMERPGAPTPTPVDLWQRYEAPDIPPGVLPEIIERFAVGHAEIMGADPAGLAMSALAVCAAAITDEIAVQVKTHDPSWRENARLWIGLVGQPSSKKSPIMRAAMAPLHRLDRDMAARNAEKTRVYAALPKPERDATAPPAKPRLVVEDATMEALQVVLQDSPRGVFSIQDELSGWFGAMDKYNSGKGSAADRAFWLKAFNGGEYSLDRVVRGSVQIPNLSIGLLGGIQPEPLRKIAGDSIDDGLIQRFLPVILRPASEGQDTPSGGVVEAYDGLVERLARLRPPLSGNLGKTAPVRFGADARPIRERVERENVKLIQALEEVSPKLASHFGKHDGIFARLCLLFHCIDCADAGLKPEISSGVAERVARFMEAYLRPSAVAFYAGMLGMSAGHEDLMALAAFIVSDGLAEISAREVQRSTRALRHVTADGARLLCEKLEAFGWLEPIESRQRSNTPRWRVVPDVHVMFEERGRMETERRAAAKTALMEALRA